MFVLSDGLDLNGGFFWFCARAKLRTSHPEPQPMLVHEKINPQQAFEVNNWFIKVVYSYPLVPIVHMKCGIRDLGYECTGPM